MGMPMRQSFGALALSVSFSVWLPCLPCPYVIFAIRCKAHSPCFKYPYGRDRNRNYKAGLPRPMAPHCQNKCQKPGSAQCTSLTPGYSMCPRAVELLISHEWIEGKKKEIGFQSGHYNFIFYLILSASFLSLCTFHERIVFSIYIKQRCSLHYMAHYGHREEE